MIVKRTVGNCVAIAVVIAVMVGLTAFYLYDVLVWQTPFTKNLMRMVLILFFLGCTLLRLFNGTAGSPQLYEKAYEKELGEAFRHKKMDRFMLIGCCRWYNEGNYRKALNNLYRLLKKATCERDAVPVLLFIALCYSDVGLNDYAIQAYHKLLQYDPQHAQAHSNLGMRYIAIGDFDSALKHYNKSIEIDPHNYYAYVNRANYYFRIEKYDEAIVDAKAALEVKNNGQEAASLLAIVFALLEDDEQMQRYAHLAATCGKSPHELQEAIDYYRRERELSSTETEDEAAQDEAD